MLQDYFQHYGLIVILAFVAFLVPVSMLLISWMFSFMRVRPKKPNPVKSSVYECGMEPIGQVRWSHFNFRYYQFAILFVVFDVETVFLYPWAIKFRALGLFALIEMAVFVLILVVGWLYAWRKRALEWE